MAAKTLVLGAVAIDATETTAGNGRLVNVPAGTRTLYIQPRAAPVRLLVQDEAGAVAVADAGAIGTAYLTLAAGTLYSLPVPHRQGGWTVWVAPDAAAAVTVEYYPSPAGA